jgi:hypothetical protein
MSRPPTPLSILDLAPIVSGGSARQALHNSIDLAQRAEAAGYRRFWLAEHHFTPGVASSAPALLIGQVAAATSTIRVGSAAVQTGHQTPLAIVEQFGVLGVVPRAHRSRLGRSGQSREERSPNWPPTRVRPPTPGDGAGVVDGCSSKPFSWAHLSGVAPALSSPAARSRPQTTPSRSATFSP